MEVIKPSKKIINYLDKLTSLSDVEQIYKFLYQELSSFKKIRNISLCFSTSVNNNVIYYKEKSRVCAKQLEVLWSADTNMRLDNLEDSKFLANCLKRPVGQLLSFPLRHLQSFWLHSMQKIQQPLSFPLRHLFL